MSAMQSALKIKLNRRINIPLSLYPSFASTLFRVEYSNSNVTLTKLIGYSVGAKITVAKNEVVCEGTCKPELLKEWLGLWFNPWTYINDVHRDIKPLIFKLIESYESLTLITSSVDWKIILIATFLSRRTNYHVNVIKWIRKIFSNVESDDLTKIKNRIRSTGRSYQLRQLVEVLEELYTINFNKNPWSIRRDLLEIKYVGPKTVDAFLLFSGKGSIFTPSDVHYARFAKRVLGIENYVMPSKNMCLAYDGNCLKCPYANKCLTGKSIKLFGRLSGWIQTIAYVHDKLFCMKNKCRTCMFKDICSLRLP